MSGKPKNCICKKPAKFYVARLSLSFCSDTCYENAQRKNPEKPHIVVTRQNGAFFEQGDIRFSVFKDSLERTLGAAQYKYVRDGSCIDKLTDSQLVMLATANKIPCKPFVRSLLRSPLHGIVQIAWYRDLKAHTSEHLVHGQFKRLQEYERHLREWQSLDATEVKQTPRRTAIKSLLTHTFRALPRAKGIEKGRAQQVFDIVKACGEATLAQIIEKAKGKVKTKQDVSKIVTRFVRILVRQGAVQEVKQ